MPKYLVISTSGNPDSNSRRMGRVAFEHLQKRKVDCDWIDIRELDLPLCDAGKCYGLPSSRKLSAAIEHADGILIAAPAGRSSCRRCRSKCFSHEIDSICANTEAVF